MGEWWSTCRRERVGRVKVQSGLDEVAFALSKNRIADARKQTQSLKNDSKIAATQDGSRESSSR